MRAIILHGPPGSGRTTIGEHLAKCLHHAHLVSPELFVRREVSRPSSEWRLRRELGATESMTDAQMNEILEELIENVPGGVETLIIEGCPHNSFQMRHLGSLLNAECVDMANRMGVILSADPTMCLSRLEPAYDGEAALERVTNYNERREELCRMIQANCRDVYITSVRADQSPDNICLNIYHWFRACHPRSAFAVSTAL